MQTRSWTQRSSTRKRTNAAYYPERASRSKRNSLLALGSAGVVLTRATTLILAAAAGIAVANLYYIQPVLELIARDFHAGAREAGWISLLMQLGYALGILLCVPLGDILERRTLSVALLACATFGLVAMAIAPGVAWLAVAGFVAGAATIVAQVLMPFAADLATPETRGRVVATVQTGLIIGTVYARAAGGLIGAHFGWRMVFWFAAGITVISTVVLARILPLRKPHSTLTYPELLRSVVALTKEYPVLRASMGLGFFAFVTFSAFWTTIAFHMKALGYGSDVVGTLGLTALIGAFVAIPFGSLADKRGTVFTAAIAVIVLAVSFVIFLAGANSLVAFFAGMVLFPIGMQLNQISNQSRIFGLDEQARSRLNTAYMFTVFSGGAVGAFVSGIAWQWGGWSAVCGLSLVAIACAAVIVVWLRNHVALRAS